MPLVLPELGIIIEDAKPKRDCAFPECPRRSRGFDGHKMKACGKCKYVRYCSKDCQRSHWRTHKQRCAPQGPPLSPSTWLYTYEGVFRWAAVEILRLHSADSLLKDGLTLSLTVVHGKQALGQDWPSDFLLKSITLSHHAGDDSRESRQCAEIQDAGGIGCKRV
ncbi:hypothetical protein BDZ89DRAFT_360790 [Hymenopellis radicata]|nr:hypothetical protein BDZ89DRAFT_360790 [Hymenopellis radicata]